MARKRSERAGECVRYRKKRGKRCRNELETKERCGKSRKIRKEIKMMSPSDEHGSGVLPIDGESEGEAKRGETKSLTTGDRRGNSRKHSNLGKMRTVYLICEATD